MKRIFSLLLISAIFGACEKRTSQTTNPDAEQEIKLDNTNPSENQLTEQQMREGWLLLFDGKSLDGWRIFKGKENNSWEVTDGALHCKAFEVKGSEKRADLITNEQYKDFELDFEWKVQKQSNSGVMFRVVEDFEEPYASGPEYQLLDDISYTDVEPTNFTGCLYGMFTVEKKKLNRVGEWNHSKIVSKGDLVEHWLNGEKILTYQINSAQWNERIATSKWKDFPGYAKSSHGHIDLQDHGNEAWFRNIMIKPL
jgi:Domain of Unknown Function (DUF1080)